MADKKEDKKEAAADKAELPPEEVAAKAKKRKLLFIVVGGVVLTAGIGAGLAFFLAGGSKETMAAKADGNADEGHGDAKAEEHAAAPAEGHAKKEGEGHDGKKEGEGHDGAKKEGEGHDAAKKEGEGHGDGTKVASKVDGVDFGCTQTLSPFHLNLGNPLENRYIRLEVAVEYGCGEEVKAEISQRLPQLRDAIISVTSRKTREFLLGPDGKEQLRKEIHTRVNHYMSRKVDDVFITDILIE